jgi:ribosome-associated translation inhibitor RaiA
VTQFLRDRAGERWLARCRPPVSVQYIDIQFHSRTPDASLAATVHRWITRFETMRFVVYQAAVAIEAEPRRKTGVSLSLTLADGQLVVAATSHDDPYVAISEAFRVARRRLLERATHHVAA